MAGSKSDFSNIAKSGKSCVGCGREVSQVKLHRLRTLARSLACSDCMWKYSKCANKSVITEQICNHAPHFYKLCPTCGCDQYIHGLEHDFDRQLAACVGMPQRTKICNSYGAKLGKCGRLIFANSAGELSRLCDKCEREWMQQNIEQDIEMQLELEDRNMVH